MKPPQIKTMLKWNLKKAKKEYWKYFSIFIRMREKGVCFTCGKKIPDYYNRKGKLIEGWKAAQAGHFVTAANCGLALYFHPKNVHCQCYYCNINLSGNWLEYERRMIEVYGKEETEKIKAMKWQEEVKFCINDYADKIIEICLDISKMEMLDKRTVI